MSDRRLLAALAIAILALGGCGSGDPPAVGSARVVYVVDGDTIRVQLLPAGEVTYLRLVGIDSPESKKPGAPVECGALAASASLHQLAPPGTRLKLKSDSVADTRDRYGRLLAHAFVGNEQLELEQLRRGWAEVYRFADQRFDGLGRFLQAERSARSRGLGVWVSCGGRFHALP